MLCFIMLVVLTPFDCDISYIISIFRSLLWFAGWLAGQHILTKDVNIYRGMNCSSFYLSNTIDHSTLACTFSGYIMIMMK